MNIALIADLALAGLLVATIVYAAMLNRRLAVFRNGREEFAKVVEQLNEATAHAAVAIEQLRRTAAESGSTLQATINQAQTSAEELGYLVERGERAADRVENAVRISRQPEPAPRTVPAPRIPPLRAVRDPEPEPAPPPPPTPAPVAADPEPAAARQSLLKALERMR